MILDPEMTIFPFQPFAPSITNGRVEFEVPFQSGLRLSKPERILRPVETQPAESQSVREAFARRPQTSATPLVSAGTVLVSFSVVALCVSGCGGHEPGGTGPTSTPVTLSGATLAVLQGFVGNRLNSPLSGVAIEIADGPLAGATTLSDTSGKFAFSEPAPLPVTVRLRRDGYAAKSETVRLKWPSYSFWLDELDQPFNFDLGNYILRVSLDQAEATSWPALPQAPCAGIPTEMLTHRFSATVTRLNTADQFDHLVTVMGDGMPRPIAFGVALGAHEAAVRWDNFGPVDKDLGNFRYLQIMGSDSGTPGAISSSGSTVSLSNPLDIMYCQLSGPLRPANNCSQVPADQILDYHACTWNRAVMRFERQ